MPNSSSPDPLLPGYDVLIFSNDWSFIDHHRTVLLSIGFVPIAATSPEATFAILRLTTIELVIVDEDAGVQETQRILKHTRDETPHVPVLVVSSRPNDESRRQALELGAAGHLDHPALQDDVVQALLPDRPRRADFSWEPQRN